MADYTKLATLIGRYPECMIYRRYGTLNAKRLLHMQAELSHLEHEVAVISQTDHADPSNRDFGTSWKKMSEASADAGANMQAQKAAEVSEKMNQYYNALLQTHHILQLSAPEKPDSDFLRLWLDWEEGGACFLQGFESEPYEEYHAEDLLTLCPTASHDPLAQSLSNKIVPLLHRYTSHRRDPTSDQGLGALWEYKHGVFVLLADVICATLASLIPILSICLLYYIQSMFNKLIIVSVMNFIFSFILAIGIRARRVEVFAASTAFAAVQVVFIGGVTYLLREN